MLIPYTFPLFVKLTPLALLLSSTALAFFHPKFTPKAIVVFLIIYFFGFFVEVYGVNTGIIFGHYAYGDGLGTKLFNTPLIIGLNWLMLIYIASSIFENVRIHTVLKIILASGIMLIYDLIIEQIAPEIILASGIMLIYDLIIEQIAPDMHMWEFSGNQVPLQNYAGWFLIAVFFHSLIKLFRVKTKNRLAAAILICQVVFFLILLIAFKK